MLGLSVIFWSQISVATLWESWLNLGRFFYTFSISFVLRILIIKRWVEPEKISEKAFSSWYQVIENLLRRFALISVHTWYNDIHVTVLCGQPCDSPAISCSYQVPLNMPNNAIGFPTCNASTTCWQIMTSFVTTFMQTRHKLAVFLRVVKSYVQ